MDVVGNVNLILRATPQSKPILVHINRVKHLKQSDFHVQFDSKRRENSDEGGPQLISRRIATPKEGTIQDVEVCSQTDDAPQQTYQVYPGIGTVPTGR